ncbi:glycosyltransferase family 4 protein [Streptomyces olivoreticuli]
MLHSMLRPLALRGHQVNVWLSHSGKLQEEYEIDGIQVIPQQQGFRFASEARKADILVSQYENVPIASSFSRAHGIPLVVVCHDNFPTSFRNAAGADLLVCNSQWIRREADVFYSTYPEGYAPKRIMVVRPPVFASDYRTSPGEYVTLVNLNEEKGGEVFWKIAAWMPEWKFLGVCGSYGTQIKPPIYLQNCEVVDTVPGGRMKDVVYSRSRIVLMPSLYESWGRVAVEAFASGIPVVAHPTPGLLEALGGAGIFAYRDDLPAWINALKSLAEQTAWAQASQRAKERSRQLDPTSEIGQWCKAVERLL